jgi:hypothetical protein
VAPDHVPGDEQPRNQHENQYGEDGQDNPERSHGEQLTPWLPPGMFLQILAAGDPTAL